MTADYKQIFHVFLFNIRNYSPEERNTQLHETELFMEYLFTIPPKHQRKSDWMLTRQIIFQWQHNYVFFYQIIQVEQLFWIIWYQLSLSFFLKSLSTIWVIINRILVLSHETDNFKGWPEIKSWNLFQINGIAITDVTEKITGNHSISVM